MLRRHRHKAKPKLSRDYGWTHCVLPPGYEFDARGRRHDDGAHGGIVIVDRCGCGAERLLEANGGRRNYGPWEEASR